MTALMSYRIVGENRFRENTIQLIEDQWGGYRLRWVSNDGKQILVKVQEAFDLQPEVNLHAMEVLRRFGNMSSATILFVLDRMMKDPAVQGEILSLGFGPGLTLETLHLEKR